VLPGLQLAGKKDKELDTKTSLSITAITIWTFYIDDAGCCHWRAEVVHTSINCWRAVRECRHRGSCHVPGTAHGIDTGVNLEQIYPTAELIAS